MYNSLASYHNISANVKWYDLHVRLLFYLFFFLFAIGISCRSCLLDISKSLSKSFDLLIWGLLIFEQTVKQRACLLWESANLQACLAVGLSFDLSVGSKSVHHLIAIFWTVVATGRRHVLLAVTLWVSLFSFLVPGSCSTHVQETKKTG